MEGARVQKSPVRASCLQSKVFAILQLLDSVPYHISEKYKDIPNLTWKLKQSKMTLRNPKYFCSQMYLSQADFTDLKDSIHEFWLCGLINAPQIGFSLFVFLIKDFAATALSWRGFQLFQCRANSKAVFCW